MTNHDYAQQLRETAEALEDAQRAYNHLDALIRTWDEQTDEERLRSCCQALTRLDHTWRDL